MKVGLVLEGGGMRCLFMAAVLDAFIDENIKVDMVSSVSAGSLFGVNYLSKQKGRALRYSKKYNPDPFYIGWRPLLKEGNVLDTQYAYVDLVKRLDPFDNETFKKANIPFVVVLTDVHSGESKYVNIYDVFEQIDTLRATGSLPFLSNAVEIEGHKYLDGGIYDSIPYEWMMKQGCDKIIVILTRNTEYRKEPFSKFGTFIYRFRYPKIAEGLKHRHEMYNRKVVELQQLEKEGKVFIIRPDEPINITRLERDPEKLQAVYDLGVHVAKERMEALKAYLAE